MKMRSSTVLKYEQIGAPLNLKSIGRLIRFVIQLSPILFLFSILSFSCISCIPNNLPNVLFRLCTVSVKNLNTGYWQTGRLVPILWKTYSADLVLCLRKPVIIFKWWPSGGNFCWLKCLYTTFISCSARPHWFVNSSKIFKNN